MEGQEEGGGEERLIRPRLLFRFLWEVELELRVGMLGMRMVVRSMGMDIPSLSCRHRNYRFLAPDLHLLS